MIQNVINYYLVDIKGRIYARIMAHGKQALNCL